MEKDCLIYEFYLIIFFLIILTIFTIKEFCTYLNDCGALNYLLFIYLIINSIFLLIVIICHSVFLSRIINNDISYNCSDEITNEVLRKERKNTKKTIFHTKINLIADIFFFILSVFSLLLAYLSYKFKDRLFLFNKQNKTNVNKNIDNYNIKKSTSKKTTKDTI